MPKRKNKKVNPRRIPLSKKEIDPNAILEEATQSDLYDAWLLVMNTLIGQERVTFDSISDLTEGINQYIRNPYFQGENRGREIEKAERLMGIPYPYGNLRIEHVNSAVELAAFKRKVRKQAIHTALCVLCLGLDYTKSFTAEELRQIFFDVDLTLAEIDRGITSYLDLEKRIAAYGVILERESDDLHHAHIIPPEKS